MALGLAVFAGAACQPVPVVPGLPTTTTKPVTTTTKPVTTTTKPVTTTTIAPPPLAKAYCASGSTITVNVSIVTQVQQLLNAAKADGLSLCGGGYRSAEAQIAVRTANCGTTYDDIYVKPASECIPPTALPGTSMHEKGLAIDFINCSTHTTACWIWLNGHAATYGLKNLASEPWHWSTTGG